VTGVQTCALPIYKLQSSLYTELLSKKQAAEIAKASSIPNAKVLDYATPYRVYKVSPEPSSYYQKYVLLFLVLSIFIIVLIEFFNNKIIDKMDVSSITDVPILGSIPGNNKAATLVLLDQPKSVIAEAFRTLRTNIRYLSRKEEAKTILLTSTVSGEGKTFCSANLAAAYALQGKKTVLIGADLRKPKIHLDFKLQNKIGLSNYLIGKATIEAITQTTNFEMLDLIASGPIPPNPSELLSSPEFIQFIHLLKDKYDRIIIDTSPIGLVSDARILIDYTDVMLFVVRQRYTIKSTFEKVINELSVDKNKLGIVVNDIRFKKSFYGKYGYG